MAKQELEEELAGLEGKDKEVDKQLTIAMTRLKKMDAMYKKVIIGGALNDLECEYLELIRI